VQIICTKCKKMQIWKHIISLSMIQWKRVSSTKQRIKVNHKIKDIKIVFLWFLTKHFCYEISMFEHAQFFFLHYGLHSLQVLHNKWCSPYYMCIMWKETIERTNQPIEERWTILLNVIVYFYWIKLFLLYIHDQLNWWYSSLVFFGGSLIKHSI